MKKSKIQNVKEWLLTFKPLTARGSREMWGYDRLAAGIGILRKRGMNIETTQGYDFRTKTYFGIYKLVKEVEG